MGDYLQRGMHPTGFCRCAIPLDGWSRYGGQLNHCGVERIAFNAVFNFQHSGGCVMDILFILIPLSVLMAIVVLGGLWWAIYQGQFEDIEEEGKRILEEDE